MEIDFEKEVVEKSKSTPILAQFTAKWCGPCKTMKPILKGVVGSRSDFELVVVDVDTNPHPAMNQGVRSIPTLLMFKGGKVASRLRGGGFTTAQLNKWLDSSLT